MDEKQTAGVEEVQTPSRRDPFGDIDLFGRLRPMGEGLGGWPRMMDEWFRTLRPERAAMPAIDITESDDQYVVTVELPGMKKEDVTIELKDHVLTIRGEKRSEREEKKERRRLVERSYGSFSRSFGLPPDASADHIEATFAAGVLTLEIRRSEAQMPRFFSVRD